VHLRPLRGGDFDTLFSVASDPLIWEQHPDSDRYQPHVFRAFFDKAMESRGALLVTDAKTGRTIGSSRYRYDAQREEIEIGWTFLARSHWGGAHNGEMKRLMLAHAFGFVETVIFRVGEHNVRSRTAVERIGGVLSGEAVDDAGRRVVVYSIRKPDFAAR